jgi:Golgi SNAP receptor complex protein 2
MEIEKYGEDIIGNLFTQNQTLKNVKTRTMQMLNTIGMSESILKLMERRSKTDMLIFIGLAILTLVLIYFLIAIVKPMLGGTSGTTMGSSVHTEE